MPKQPEPAVQAEPEYDPETQVVNAEGDVVDMPTGQWTAALTEAGNLRRSKGLLVLG